MAGGNGNELGGASPAAGKKRMASSIPSADMQTRPWRIFWRGLIRTGRTSTAVSRGGRRARTGHGGRELGLGFDPEKGEEWVEEQVAMRGVGVLATGARRQRVGAAAWARGRWRHGASAPCTMEKKRNFRKIPLAPLSVITKRSSNNFGNLTRLLNIFIKSTKIYKAFP